MKRLRFIIRYIKYYITAKNKYKIHSPFIYDLLINVIYYEDYEPEFNIIEDIRENLLENENYVEFNDLGAGSQPCNRRLKIKAIAKNSAKSFKYSGLLFKMVKHFEPITLIELGTSFGISSMYQAIAAPNGKLITIEGSKEIAKIAQQNFEKLKLKNIELIISDFDTILPEVLKKTDKLDYVFFDGNHRKEPTINYFEQCVSKTHVNSVFIVDDIHWSKGMEEAWEYIKAHDKVTFTIDLFYLGLVFFVKSTVKQNHIIRF